MAALLATRKHNSAWDQGSLEAPSDFEIRSSKSVAYLQDNLQRWDVEAYVHNGFGILVPALFSMLEQEQIFFSFPGRHLLIALNEKRLRKFDPHDAIRDG